MCPIQLLLDWPLSVGWVAIAFYFYFYFQIGKLPRYLRDVYAADYLLASSYTKPPFIGKPGNAP